MPRGVGPEPDLDAAVATYWSSGRVGVSREDVVEAWSAAVDQVWKDERYCDAGEVTRADFLYNSGHVRMSVCECALLVAPVWSGTTHFLTAVVSESFGLNLGWALHTRTLDAVWGEEWSNPWFGEEALRHWRQRERMRVQAEGV